MDYELKIFEDEDVVKNKFIKNINIFKNSFDNSSVLAGTKLVTSNHLNFFNFESKDKIKSIIDYEILQIYSDYPRSAELLIEWITEYFCKNQITFEYSRVKSFINEKMEKYEDEIKRFDMFDNLLAENCDKKINSIFKKVLENADADDVIFVEKSARSETIIKKTNLVNFLIEFDQDFLLGKNSLSREDYKYIIIDGYIDKVSEIYHLLEEANQTKEPYIIFCKGMSEEVKSVVIKNLMRKTIDVLPISLKTNEENVNVLNDIASCHDNEVVSSFKGDTISSAVRRKLSRGKYIKISNNNIILKYKNNKTRKRQLSYLNKKIKNLNDHDPNKEFVNKRIKNLNSKKISIFLGKDINKKQEQQLGSLIKNLKNVKRGIVKSKDSSEYICYTDLVICVNKFLSILKSIHQIGGALALEKNENRN